ncbi:lactadherin-like [Patiria miniata]|uniref:F5/8 type C domain-containing protein n=1 Tax=Patiria miniata TaxID=46514 RepID=A0A914ADX1_PATMI|nr:lactadherin-like [Patiria miniata]
MQLTEHSIIAPGRMDGAVAWILMASAMAAVFVVVESEARTCYFGPPPEPDPDHPDDWMKQVMREVRARCPGPGRRQPTPAATAECFEPLGMEDRTIPDDHITASSVLVHIDYPGCCKPEKGRLNSGGLWKPSSSADSWIEVNLAKITVVSGVITKSRPPSIGWVTEYKVAYKKEPASEYEHVTDANGNVKVFMGNTDHDTPVTNMFGESVVATVVRIEPSEWHVQVRLQLELLGCRRD